MDDRIIEYTTSGGLRVTRTAKPIDGHGVVEDVIDKLDAHRGALFTSTYEYPGRYTRWSMGFVDPALVITSNERHVNIEAATPRGLVLLDALETALAHNDDLLIDLRRESSVIAAELREATGRVVEEERSRRPSVFSVLRKVIDLFHSSEDDQLGLYGAFGYDLAFQFEPVDRCLERSGDQRDLVLYVPEELFVIDHKRELAHSFSYDFEWNGNTSRALPRIETEGKDFVPGVESPVVSDHVPGEYAELVEVAKESFRRGDLFEVVPGQTFSQGCQTAPSALFRELRQRNPAPYGALINLGDQEYLISASPEMYVRVEGRRIETCPISGTIARGSDAFGDADQILRLLNSEKDESELTMCTDVDRNDKSRICEPGSVKVIGRRNIEQYSKLFHTVDHVEGTLLPGLDALDGFLAHTWAVTVTGAPKLWAMRFIEQHEKSARAWYGGAIGALLFNGNANTGLTLRTIRVKNGRAEVRAGATLMIDSDPAAEEAETEVKAGALLDVLNGRTMAEPLDRAVDPARDGPGIGRRILLVDHEDSFVHTLGSYFRRTGAMVTTVRVPVGQLFESSWIDEIRPDLVVISPGPGKPSDFHLARTLDAVLGRDLPVFGVCLGLQAIVEYFGGELGVLDYPAHGRSSKVTVTGGRIFEGLPVEFSAGRYHSIVVERIPDELRVTATTDDLVIMGIEHEKLPVAAVQFHPESLMTMADETGQRLIDNVVRYLR